MALPLPPEDDLEPASPPGPSSLPEELSAPTDPAEAERIRAAQRGDERAFEALVRAHQQRAFRVARHMVPSDEDAQDIVQEAFLRVFRSLERFDFQYGFSTWLNRIVTNLAIDHLRRRRLVTQSAGEDDDGESWESELQSAAPSPSERMEASETARTVRDCIAALAPHFQSVLTLREIEGLACTEIAKIVGATHVTVRWRLHRGRKLFLEEWERRERAAEAGADRAENKLPRANEGGSRSVDREGTKDV
jgi:RNA polymerase sigma-70 factor (ECF subfamily)